MNPISNVSKIRMELYTKVAEWAFKSPMPIEVNEEVVEKLASELVPSSFYNGRYEPEYETIITKHRLRLALGLEKKQVVNGIPEACNSCFAGMGVGKYFVTELCQNCTSRLCQNSCPKKAIQIVDGRALIDKESCIGCGICAKNCPYGAIRKIERPCVQACGVGAVKFDDNDKVVIDAEICVSCGACLVACPFGAIDDYTQIVDLIRAIRSKEHPVIAMPAPALAGQFGPKATPHHLKAALLKLGFDEVVEVALGADLVAQEEAEELIERYDEQIMTNSCCPAYLMAIKKKLPKLADRISHTKSPMRTTGEWVRKHRNERVINVFIGPCSAKKAEMSWGDEIDIVMTFEEIAAMFKAVGIEPEKEEPVDMKDATNVGRMFARTGGVAGAVAEILEKEKYKEKYPVILINPTTLKGSLNTLKMEANKAKKRKEFTLVEGMACVAGCISGPGTIAAVTAADRALTKYVDEGRKNELIKPGE